MTSIHAKSALLNHALPSPSLIYFISIAAYGFTSIWNAVIVWNGCQLPYYLMRKQRLKGSAPYSEEPSFMSSKAVTNTAQRWPIHPILPDWSMMAKRCPERVYEQRKEPDRFSVCCLPYMCVCVCVCVCVCARALTQCIQLLEFSHYGLPWWLSSKKKKKKKFSLPMQETGSIPDPGRSHMLRSN